MNNWLLKIIYSLWGEVEIETIEREEYQRPTSIQKMEEVIGRLEHHRATNHNKWLQRVASRKIVEAHNHILALDDARVPFTGDYHNL